MVVFTIKDSNKQVEIIDKSACNYEPLFNVRINTLGGRIIQSFDIEKDELDLLVTALLMLKEQLSKVSQA